LHLDLALYRFTGSPYRRARGEVKFEEKTGGQAAYPPPRRRRKRGGLGRFADVQREAWKSGRYPIGNKNGRRRKSEVVSKKGAEFRLKGKDSRRFCVLAKVEGSQGWVEFTVKSKHGGTDTKRVTIKKS
jgi:hypothetical protein